MRTMEEQQHKGMAREEEHNVIIVGGGVAGLATALSLHRIGIKSIVLEQSSSLRTSGAAFVMWPNAWSALETLGVANSLRSTYHLLNGIHGSSQTRGFTSMLSFTGKEVRCVERSELLEILAKELPQNTIRFNSKLASVNTINGDFTQLMLSDGTSFITKVVLGCDGVYSAVARWLGLEDSKSIGRCAIRGLANYPKESSSEKLMVQMMGAGCRTGYLPCKGDELYWCVTREVQPSDASIYSDINKVRESALDTVKGFPEIMKELIDLSPKETLNMAELKIRWVWPWKWSEVHGKKERKRVALVGDAFHPIAPDVGQGACLALEDAVVIAKCFANAGLHHKNSKDWSKDEIGRCLDKYREMRKWRVFFIGFLAYYSGLVQEGTSTFTRVARDWLYLPIVGMTHFLYAIRFESGQLPRETCAPI